MANVGTSFVTASLLLDIPQLPGIWAAKMKLGLASIRHELSNLLIRRSNVSGVYASNQLDLESETTNSYGRRRLYSNATEDSNWVFGTPL